MKSSDVNLLQRRKQLGLSQEVLANYWNVIQATISNWETGKHKIQHPEIVNDALKYLENLSKSELERLQNGK